jgi:cell division septation protein DedD
MRRLLMLMSVVFLSTEMQAGAQQTGPDVQRYLSMIEGGQGETVKAEIPALLTKYPNNPGVLYLQGLLTRDGTEAVRIYQSIVDNFPQSGWAPYALYKIYQFYSAIGLYRTAELKMNQLKKDYPASKYVTQGGEVETKQLAEEKTEPVVLPPDTPAARRQGGVAMNEEEEKPAGPAVNPRPESSRLSESRGQFALQVGAFSSLANAEKQKAFFEKLKFTVEVISRVRDSKSLYTVMIGNYKTYDQAKAKQAELKKRYKVDSMVVTR